jgi:Ca2+/H+ antiporter
VAPLLPLGSHEKKKESKQTNKQNTTHSSNVLVVLVSCLFFIPVCFPKKHKNSKKQGSCLFCFSKL